LEVAGVKKKGKVFRGGTLGAKIKGFPEKMGGGASRFWKTKATDMVALGRRKREETHTTG